MFPVQNGPWEGIIPGSVGSAEIGQGWVTRLFGRLLTTGLACLAIIPPIEYELRQPLYDDDEAPEESSDDVGQKISSSSSRREQPRGQDATMSPLGPGRQHAARRHSSSSSLVKKEERGGGGGGGKEKGGGTEESGESWAAAASAAAAAVGALTTTTTTTTSTGGHGRARGQERHHFRQRRRRRIHQRPLPHRRSQGDRLLSAWPGHKLGNQRWVSVVLYTFEVVLIYLFIGCTWSMYNLGIIDWIQSCII